MAKPTRRRFIHLCAGAAASVSASSAALLSGCRGETNEQTAEEATEETTAYTAHQRVRLLDADGGALTASRLAVNEEYLFFYPYVSTPCFLLRLEKPPAAAKLQTAAGDHYRWPGGAGSASEGASVVAFAAICAHKLSYPSKPVSFIGYRSQANRCTNQPD